MVKTGCFRLRFSPRNQCIEYIWILGYNSGYLNLDLYAGFVTMSKINLDSPSICHQFVTGEIPEIGEKNRLENLQPRKWWKNLQPFVPFFDAEKALMNWAHLQPGVLYISLYILLPNQNEPPCMAQDYLGHFFESDESEICTYIYIDIGQTLARPIPIFQGQRAQGEDA